MISVDEALDKVLASVSPLDPEQKPLLSCLGQVLAEDAVAGVDIPPADNSAMDGFAVRSGNTRGASPKRPVYLETVGEIQAGHESSVTLADGQAVRIMTGAPIPGGADAVVRFEDTDQADSEAKGGTSGKVAILEAAGKGLNIRLKGEDMRVGQTVLRKGALLGPADVGLLAALGHPQANVIRRPVVAVLPTGDELCEVGRPLSAGKIYNSNTYSLAAAIIACGGIPRVLEIARDSVESLDAAMSKALGADLLVTSGGVSMGDYDVVRDVMASKGEMVFWKVRMKPGKPLAFGLLQGGSNRRRVPHLGLPGNPVSSMVTFELYARPAILKMLGRTDLRRPIVTARLREDIANSDGRRVFARVRLQMEKGELTASLTGPQGSGILTSMSAANGLAVVPEDCPLAKAGSVVRVMMLDGCEELC